MPYNKNDKMTKHTYNICYIYIYTHTMPQFYLREGINVLTSMFINVPIRRAMGG